MKQLAGGSVIDAPWWQFMYRYLSYLALALYFAWIPATAGERYGQWSLEQPGDFIIALSFKRSITFDGRAGTSELAFVCNQENKYVGVLLIPRDGTFKNRQDMIPVAIQKIENQSDPSDLMELWENGPGYIFLEFARRARGTCLVPKGQRSRRREVGSLSFRQRCGCGCANDQSHCYRPCGIFRWSSGFYKGMRTGAVAGRLLLCARNGTFARL